MSDGEETYFPIWPHREYAQLLAKEEWANYSAASIDLETLRTELLVSLEDSGFGVALFPTPQSRGISVSASEFAVMIDDEQKKY